MKSGRKLLLAALTVAVGGCAALMPPRPADLDAALHLDRGLAAVESDRYAEARSDLTWVYRHCPSREAGARALVALAALELDPRNPEANPALGTELLARALRSPGTPGWSRPLAETGFLISLALGAPHPDHSPAAPGPDAPDAPDAEPEAAPDSAAAVEGEAGAPVRAVEAPEPLDPQEVEGVYGCGAEIDGTTWTAPALPTLPGPSMAAMLTAMQAQRDSIAMSADTLRAELTAARGQLAATREELERIRRTLKP